MNRVRNKVFAPVNKSEAKDTIFRPVMHNEELRDFSIEDKNSNKKIRDKFQNSAYDSSNRAKTNV
jgi:hypothetical protein